MPISVATARDPFRGEVAPQPAPSPDSLRIPQARVLQALMPAHPEDPPSEWPLFTRAVLGARAGYSPTNSLNRLLNGVPRGLIRLQLIEFVTIDVEGVQETNYRITRKGIQCLSRHENDHK